MSYKQYINVCRQCQGDYCIRCSLADDPDDYCSVRCEGIWDADHPLLEQEED